MDSYEITWAPGENNLYQQPGNRNFHLLNPETQEERPLVGNDSVGWMFSARYAPDGNTVAVFWNRRPKESAVGIWTISLEDASQSQVQRLGTDEMTFLMRWSSDGEWIYARIEKKVTMIPVRGGDMRTAVTLPFEGIVSPCDVTPDGKRVVCSVLETQSDVWLMENFDPAVQ